VEVTVTTSHERVRISVRDTGSGLSAQKIDQLYTPFNRLGQDGAGTQGTGIGLVMTKRLVELMGGEIGVSSEVGVGSVFWVEMLAGAAPVEGDAASLELEQSSGACTVLYIEDNPANLKLVQRLIARRPGMRLEAAVTATMGIQLARTRQPTLILMDINLPDMSGVDALRILQDDPATSRIPVLAITSNAQPSDIEEGMKAGFLRYINKPIKVADFMAALDVAIDARETADGVGV
jgi:CheY-like chemotaxis protein